MIDAIDKLYRGYRWFLEAVIGNAAALVMLWATALAISEILRRYVFRTTFEWGQDAVTFVLVSALVLYFAVTQSRRSHLAVEAVVDVFKKKNMVRTILVFRTIVSAVTLAVTGALAWWGLPTISRSMMMERTTESMHLLVWPFQTALMIGFALMAVSALFHLYQDIMAVRGIEVFDWAPVEEGLDI